MSDGFECPHCQHEHENWYDYVDFAKDNQEFDTVCENCRKDFHVVMLIARTWETHKKNSTKNHL